MMGVALVFGQVRIDTSKFSFAHGASIMRITAQTRRLVHEIAWDDGHRFLLDSVNALANCHAYGNAYSRVRQIARYLTNYQLVAPEHTEALSRATEGLIEGGAGSPSATELRQCTICLMQRLMESLNIPRVASELSEDELDQWDELLRCTQRVLECRKAAERVTQAGWDAVCRMLVAPASSAS